MLNWSWTDRGVIEVDATGPDGGSISWIANSTRSRFQPYLESGDPEHLRSSVAIPIVRVTVQLADWTSDRSQTAIVEALNDLAEISARGPMPADVAR